MNISGTRSRQLGRWITTLAVLILLILTRSSLSWAVDLGNGLTLSNLTYLDFTQASGDLFDTGSSKDISDDQARANMGLADGFHFTRVYITLMKEVNDQLLIRITTDQMSPIINTTNAGANNEATPFGLSGFGGGNGRANFFVKYAYVQYKFSPALMIRAGQTQTPWIDTAEVRWTLRFLRPTYWDEQGALTSSDLGVAALGSLFKNLIGYHVMFSNGEGYENNGINGRGYAGQGRIDLNLPIGVTFSAFGLTETLDRGIANFNPTREIFYVMYSNDLFRISAEYMMADDGDVAPTVMTTYGSSSGSKGPATGSPRYDQAKGYGAWAWTHIPGVEPLRLFGRFYTIKPNQNTDAGKTTEINVGVSYDLYKELIVAIDDTILTQKMLRTSDDSIEDFKNNIIGVHAQLSF